MLHRNRPVIAMAVLASLAFAAPVAGAAAAKFILGGPNTAPSTTTIQMAGPGAVVSLQNTGSGSTSAGLDIAVSAGRTPITVSPGAGKATNLDADSVDGHDASDFVQGPAEGWHLIGAAGEPAWGRITLTSLDP